MNNSMGKTVKADHKKKIIFIAVGVVVLFLAWKIYQKVKPQRAPGANSAVAVEIAAIGRGSLRDTASYTGSLTAKTRVVVAPKVAGRLEHLQVDIGDAVRSGQLLATLEDEEYQQEVLQAEANRNVTAATLEEAKSALVIAEKNLEREKALHQSGFQSDAQLDEVQSQYESQLAQVNVAQAQLANREAVLANSRLRLANTRISAAWDRGSPQRYVGERFADEGALLSVSTPILSIVDLQPLIAVINVNDQEYYRLRPGQTAQVTSTAFAGKQFAGRIARIAPLLQEGSRQARVEIEVDNSELLLKPGMFINAQVEFAKRDDIPVVPFNALAKRDGQQGIFLVDIQNQTARFQPVQTGIIDSEMTEIAAPADISGYVVVMGHYLLEKEGRVILPDTVPPQPSAATAAQAGGK